MTFKSEIVFVRILPCFVAGILIAYLFFNESYIKSAIIFNISLLCCLIATNIFYKNLKAYQFKGVIGFVFHVCCCTFGMLASVTYNNSCQQGYFAKHDFDYLKVRVSDDPQLKQNILRFQVDVTSGYQSNRIKKASGKLLIALKIDELNPVELHYGDEMIIVADNHPVEPPYNPGEFDFKAWLGSKNIYQQTFINQNQLLKLNKNTGNRIIKYAINERKKQIAIYRKLIKDNEAFAIASTLVLGYRADLSKDTLAAYSTTGTIHALSVSGAHVGIIFFLLNAMLGFLDRQLFLKLVKLILICVLVWYYSLITGFSSSVLRSAIMLTIFMVAKAFSKTSNNYNILAFTAFCLLIYNPFYVWDVGFQLSFLSVFGLIYLQPKIYKWIYIKNKWLDKLWAATALSLAAQLATFPLSIYYFHQFPVYFILGNLFILLPLVLMMYLGIGILVLKLYFLAPIFEWLITFTNNGLKWISALPFSKVASIWLSQWQLFLLSLALALMVYALVKYHKKILIASVFLLLIFQLHSSYYKIEAQSRRKIIFFSLRKNYAAAFIAGNKAVILTDLKPEDRNYQFFVAPALDKNQVNQFEFVNWKQDTVINSFQKRHHQLAFYNYKILLIDQNFNFKKIAGLPNFNAIWLHQNVKKPIIELRNEILFSTVLIDASNYDYKIREFEKDANKFKLQHYTLKKNPSYLINLK